MIRCVPLLLGLLLSAAALAQQGEQPSEAEVRANLEKLRGEITKIKRALESDRGTHDQLQRDLREQDKRVAASASELAQAQGEVERLQAEGVALEAERQAVDREILAGRDELRALLRSAYAAGQWVPLKLWLDQERFADSTRALGYHQYLKSQQLAQLERIRALAIRKKELAAALLVQQGAAESALQRQAESQLALEAERAERAKHLAAAGTRLNQTQTQLDALSRNERDLLSLLEQLSNLIADVPKKPVEARPLAEQRGQLVWPAQGKVTDAFGKTGSDGRPLSGIRIAAAEGSAINAVANGRVAFADWLRGQGLLIIIDHGDGYMSLYGNCETVIRGEGDWVEAGEQLGTVGRSGGVAQAGLHFELRRGRQAIDPIPWLQRRR